ncbi:hypothetical protein QYM36_008309 [Artemia franciscana]|nr:hypothetical protein QYM36_008309 [Artemia franciscana]
MVLRAKELVFHVDCFSCQTCEVKLQKGDSFCLFGSRLLCQQHYQDVLSQHDGQKTPFPSESQFVSSPTAQHPMTQSPLPALLPINCTSFPSYMSFLPSTVPTQFYPNATMNLQNLSAPQKGRPRKRRAKLDSMDPSLMDPYSSDTNYDGSCSQQRTKRMRTSFKHHQLRMLKSYFQTNHNPDAKDLKQLSQKTGLSKRVLQVWFQNARAKWRRLVHKTDPKPDENSSENQSGDEGTYVVFSDDQSRDEISNSCEYLS